MGDELRAVGFELRVEVAADLAERLAGLAVGISRVTSVGGLSSRRPRKAAWRTRLSAVQVAKRTCATSLGSTQWTSRRASAGRRGEGHFVRRELVKFRIEFALEFLREAGAGAAGVDELSFRISVLRGLFIDAEKQRAEAVGAFGGVGVAADDELLLEAAFGLEPVGAAAGAVGGVALGDDAFGSELAGLGEDGGAAAVDVVAEAEGACRWWREVSWRGAACVRGR